MGKIFEMVIDEDTLHKYGAIVKKHEKGEIIFTEGSMPFFYYQVISGSIKVFNTNDEGKEFTQGIFTDGCSFGEPPLLLNLPKPPVPLL